MPTPEGKPPADAGEYTLDELDMDGLREVVNISVGRSADAFSRMVDTEVLMSIPIVEILPIIAAEKQLHQRAGDEIAMVRQKITGSLVGESILLFPRNNSLELVKMVVQEDLPEDMLADLEQDVMREIGNIVLNNFMAGIGDLLGLSIETGLPAFERCDKESKGRIFQDLGNNAAIVMRVDFKLHGRDVQGYLGMLVGVQSVTNLIQLIRKFIGV
jgi:chemotaxis protein CheC